MQNRIQKIIAAATGILFLPMVVFAQTSINWSISIGSSGGSTSGSNPWNLPEGSIYGILSNLLFWLLAIFGIIGVIGFVISGIFYLVSAGNDGMIEKGKSGMMYSIIGIIVGLSGYLIMQAVALFLSGADSRF